MAEAAVEERPINPRFFCHKCSVEFEHASPDFTCPHCAGGFVEILENSAEGADDVQIIDVEEDEGRLNPWSSELSAVLAELEWRNLRQRAPNDPARRRRYASVQPRHRIGRPRVTTRISGFQPQVTPFDNLIQDLILNVGVGWGGPNLGNMLFLGNPGDYAWGREGLDAIVTHLLNQDSTGPPPLTRDVIEQIPIVAISQEQVDAKVQCSVCWEDFVLGENVRKLPCQHVYHENCICPWLELHGTCPICRQNLSPGGDQAPGSDARTPNAGNFTLQEFFQPVNYAASGTSSSVSSEYTPGASSDSGSSNSSSGSSAPSDQYTTGSSSSDVEFN